MHALIRQEQEAWTEGYRAPKGAICPYEPKTDKALSWASGHIEGLAWRHIMDGDGAKGGDAKKS